ncbi:hypothetical protein [Endozoicomonas sp. 8E]|uniref:hypothetical protein n=1 Tax=Endozoicomonas sp. 8E TaxID=3035692 RepID=UPI002938E4E3|nr:hypothetical protein [Endozoicomonas sp. 8E]WOG29800.1 hypothetical protein P6910_09120 [Endozoicomonas sp. 8E]
MPTIPKKIHFALVGPAESWESICLSVWAWVNKNHAIYVWAPKALIYKRILYLLLYSERIQQRIETDYPADIAWLRRSIWQKIDAFMGENDDIERLDIMKADFSDSVKRLFTTQWNKTNDVLNQIRKTIGMSNVKEDTSDFERQHSEYIKYALSLKKPVIAERAVGISREQSEGGVYVDRGLLPALRTGPFEKNGISSKPTSGREVDSSEREQLERAKVRAVLEDMFERKLIPDPDRYFKIDDINLSQEQLNRIKSVVKETICCKLFLTLSERPTSEVGNNKIFFGRTLIIKDKIKAGLHDDSIKPMMLEAFPNNPLINKVLEETIFFHSILEKFKNNETSKEIRIMEIIKSLNEFKHRGPAYNEEIYSIATMLAELSYNNGDLDHRILAKLGYDAFKRLERTVSGGKAIISQIKSFSEENPFYSMNSYGTDSDLPDSALRRPYDKFIMINMLGFRGNGESARQSYEKHIRYRTPKGKSVLYDVVYSDRSKSLEINTILGTPFKNIGEDTKVFITGSLDFSATESSEINSTNFLLLVRKLSSILRAVIPENTTVQNIAFSFDNSAQNIPGSEGVLGADQKDYIVPEVLRELAKKGIRANSAVAVRGSLSAGIPRQTTGGDPNRPSTSRDAPDPELNRIVFTLNQDNTVTYKAKFGLDSLDPDKEFYPRASIDTPESMFADQLFESIVVENSQGSTDPRLGKDSAAALVEKMYAGDRDQDDSASARSENRLPTYEPIDNRIDASKFSYYEDFQTAIYFGLVQQPPTEKAAFVHPDEGETTRLRETLRLLGQSSSYTDWLARYERRFPNDQIDRLEREIERFASKEAKTRAFENIKKRVGKDAYHIYNIDITTPEGAAEINAKFKKDFDNMRVLPVPPQGACRRPRRSAGTGSCDARRKNLEYALRLLSGPETQLFLGNDREKIDIALREPSNESERLLQNFFTRYRRLEGKDALAHVRGMHSIIALDEDSFTRAQQQIKDGTLSGQPLLLKTTPSGSYVLLTPDGRVQSAIAGGDGNRVTVLGRPARLIAHALATLVYFTPDGHIASLTVSDLASSNQSRGITALNGLKTFMTQSPANGKPLVGELIIEPRSRSPQVFKRLVKDIQHRMPKDRPAIENLVLRSPGSGQPKYRLLPGETTVLMSPRPSDSTPPLRYLPPSHLSVPVQPRTKDSLSGVASERAEFRQRLLELDTALGDIKARHSLPDSMIPQLDTLRRDGRGWRIDFLEPDTLVRKNIRFTSGAFDRFRGFLQGTGRQGLPSLVKGKRTANANMNRLASFIGLYDLIAGISPVGHHYSQPPSQNMTVTERQIYIGRKTFFYTSLALQLIDIANVGRHGIKAITPVIVPSIPSGQKAPKLPKISVPGKLPVGLKKVGRLGKTAGRFVPFLLPSVQVGSLTLTIIEYENEEDPEVKKLMESRVIFESVDTAISIGLVLVNPVLGIVLGGIMHHIRTLFNLDYKSRAEKLAFKKLRDASGKAAKIFDLIHAQLDPESFLANNQANNQTLNALTSGDGKSLLALNIQSINLMNQTLTYGGGYSYQTTFVAGKKDDWKRCKDEPYVEAGLIQDCATDINRIEYASGLFNLIDNALATLCRTESRLTGYQCSNGVFHNLRQMTGKNNIFMPALPQWEVRLRYTPYDRFPRGSAPDSSSPGAQLLDAVSDSKLKRFYQKKVISTRIKYCGARGFDECSTRYHYKYLIQMFTHTDGLVYRQSTSSLYLDDKDHIVVFREVSDEFSKLLDYDLYRPNGNKTCILMSDGAHYIRVHPGQTASTWVLNYDGQVPYACITEQADQEHRCWSSQNYFGDRIRHIMLGETRFEFPEPRPSSPYKVVAEDANAQFEWQSDGKVIHRLYDTGSLNDGLSGASKLNRIMSRYTAASRFLPLEMKDCDASTRVRERCMARAPEQWRTVWLAVKKPNRWAMKGASDPLPVRPDRPSRVEQNPAWLQHKQDCDRQVNEYLKKPYRCFPGKLGLAKADWEQLDQVRLWYDTFNHLKIRFIADNAQLQPAQLQPVQGNPAIGYYFFDSANGKVLFQNKELLTREIWHFGELNASSFGRHVSKIMPNKDESQLLVFDAPYYYLLTASPSGQLTHRAIAVETLDGQLSVPPIPPAAASDTTTSDTTTSNTTTSNTTTSDHGLIPMRDVDDNDTRRILRAGFYDDSTQTHITFLNSLMDGDVPNNKNDESGLWTINERVRKALDEEHLPVHKVVRESVHFILFSKHSGNLYYLSTDVNRPGGVQRLNSGFQLIRPAGEKRALAKAKMASTGVFRHVQAHSGSLLVDTNGDYRLWIPDKAWDNTRVVSENLSVESGPFKNWQVEATGQIVAKSNDTLSVHQFTPQSGVVMDSLNLGRVVNLIFAKLTIEHPGRTTWTIASARFFIRELKKLLRDRVKGAREAFSATVGLVPLRPISAIVDHPLFSAIRKLDFWYNPGSDTLLAANTRDQFEVMVNDDGQLLALSNTHKKEAFEFFPALNSAP